MNHIMVFPHMMSPKVCAAQTSPGSPLALGMNIPAPAAPMPSTPSSPQQPFKSQHSPRMTRRTSMRNSPWQVRALGLSAGTWRRFLLHTSLFSCLLKPQGLHSFSFLPQGSHLLFRISTTSPFFTHSMSPLQTSHSSRLFSSAYLFFLSHSNFQYK